MATKACTIGLLLFALFVGANSVQAQNTKRLVIIDTDPGTDDAMALLFALNVPEFKIEAITVVAGNVVAEQGIANALNLVGLAGRCDIPVAKGASQPLAQKLITAEFWHGDNGLANLKLPPSKCVADSRFGPDLIIELVHQHPHEITLVPLGPLTNIAMAISKDPSIVPLVKAVVLMGGTLAGGNVSAVAEANIYGDPEAAQIVFNAGWMVTMVGEDVGEQTRLTRSDVKKLKSAGGPQSEFVTKVSGFLFDLSENYGERGTPMFDPLAVAVVLDPTLVTTRDMRVDIETTGEFTRGETVANRHGTTERNVLHGDRLWIEGIDEVHPNAHVCVASDSKRFLDLFVSRLKGH